MTGKNTFHHCLCTVVPHLESAKIDFVLAISMSRTHPLPPTQICMIIACNFSWVLQSSQEKSKTIRQWLCIFFFGAEGAGVGGNKVHCGLCENGELLSFCFPTIPPFQKNFQRPRCHYTCCHWGSLMT